MELRTSISKATVVVGFMLFLCACSGSAESTPTFTTTTHLAEYERLIDEFEPQFDQARDDPREFARVSESYRQRTKVWMDRLIDMRSDVSASDWEAIQPDLDELNKRAERMLTGS